MVQHFALSFDLPSNDGQRLMAELPREQNREGLSLLGCRLSRSSSEAVADALELKTAADDARLEGRGWQMFDEFLELPLSARFAEIPIGSPLAVADAVSRCNGEVKGKGTDLPAVLGDQLPCLPSSCKQVPEDAIDVATTHTTKYDSASSSIGEENGAVVSMLTGPRLQEGRGSTGRVKAAVKDIEVSRVLTPC